MKKSFLVAVLAAAVTGGAFAQFQVGGGVDLFGQQGQVTPAIELGYGLSNLDILAGVNFGIWNQTQEDTYDGAPDNTKETDAGNNVGIYLGVAPKVAVGEKWNLSIPLIAQIRLASENPTEYADDNMSGFPGYAAFHDTFGFDFRAGGRAAYSITENWSLYMGFLFDVVSWTQEKGNQWKGPLASDGVEDYDVTETLNVFRSGVVQFGVKYTF